MDYFARDIVGISAYDFYHANDISAIQGHHAKCKHAFFLPFDNTDVKFRCKSFSKNHRCQAGSFSDAAVVYILSSM